ncbi:hypothetical protein [Paenibacillus sp. PAMC21692]|uniref:hypothetical protein n=1 Tax=Paenibacillus sp. PAMC21692 TaxID=2762320 RepID=UPI00164DBC01|nr:hypothetical protein [Paenibacillus sp. PAMC21692]QNK58550.1 hypothetical protein H7F31_06490 [Paenibacillus sp. PAMC21692]
MTLLAEPPQVNNRMFFGNLEVVIVKIIEPVQLAKVKLYSSPKTFMVNLSALQNTPDTSSSISISILGGVL